MNLKNSLWKSSTWCENDHAQCFVLRRTLESGKPITLALYAQWTQEYLQIKHSNPIQANETKQETFQYLTCSLNEMQRQELRIPDNLWHDWKCMIVS